MISRLTFCFILLIASFGLQAQGALEDVIVEPWYTTTAGELGIENVPDTTTFTSYRIYIDLAEDYVLQAIFGNRTHALHLGSTGTVYNCATNGVNTGNYIDPRRMTRDNLILDSFITMKSVSNWHYAVPLEDDHDGSVLCDAEKSDTDHSGTMAERFCKLEKDGLLKGEPIPVEVILMDLYGWKDSTDSARISTNNGAWAVRQGVVGPTEKNRVLVAQITTDGDIFFEFNLQVNVPSGGPEQYVARDASGNEELFEKLRYNSHLIPHLSNEP
jgi:hypothetical protein